MDKFKYIHNGEEYKKTTKCIKVEVEIYKCSVVMLMPKETEEVCKAWDRERSGGAVTNNYLSANDIVLIMLWENKAEYLVHELIHAVQIIMHHIGHKCDKEADEPSAYLMGYLYKKAMSGIRKYKSIKSG